MVNFRQHFWSWRVVLKPYCKLGLCKGKTVDRTRPGQVNTSHAPAWLRPPHPCLLDQACRIFVPLPLLPLLPLLIPHSSLLSFLAMGNTVRSYSAPWGQAFGSRGTGLDQVMGWIARDPGLRGTRKPRPCRGSQGRGPSERPGRDRLAGDRQRKRSCLGWRGYAPMKRVATQRYCPSHGL